MKVSRYLAVLVAVAMVVSAAPAETAPSVLKQIPAGNMGFVVVNNVKATAARIDEFIKEIGVSKFVPPGGVLATIKGGAQLGAGFNADGGLAIAMLDPQQFGLDIMGMIKGGPNAKPPQPGNIPVVAFIAGSDVKGVFGQLAAPAQGKYFQLQLPAPFPILATAHNGYVILSPSKAALDAVVSCKKSVADALPKEHVDALVKSDLAYHINMKITGPVLSGLMKMFEDQMGGQMGAAGAMMMGDPTALLAMYRGLIEDMDAVTIGARLTSTGVAADLMVSFSPDSALGKIAAAFSSKAIPSVARLPNLPYVMAIGSLVEDSPEAQKFADDMTKKMFGAGAMPKELQAKIERMQKVANSDITSVQMVLGGAPQGAGVFGAAVLLECKNTKNVKKMLADAADLISSAIKMADPNNEELQQLKIAYAENVETAGAISVDAITITHPEMDEMGPGDRAEMAKILGDDKILVRVAAIDAKTVAVTFGGGSAYLAETIKAAKVGGRILSRKDAKQLVKYLPAKPTGYMLLSVGNLFEVINTGMRAFDEAAGGLPVNIGTKEPITISGGYTGKASHVIIYVPTKLVKDIMAAVGPFIGLGGGMGPGGGAPIPPGGDF